jgi:ribosomal protein S18 acetylase RimI-like enzyme
MEIVELEPWFDDAHFLHLVELACGFSDHNILHRVVHDELSKQNCVGFVDDGVPIAFASYLLDAAAVIEYIAVAEASQHSGLGSQLIAHVRAHAGTRDVIAETDDDAVDFYRRVGFAIGPGPAHERYPGVRRYRCVLKQDAASIRHKSTFESTF